MPYLGMAKPKRPLKRPRDPVQLAKLIGDIATGQLKDGADESAPQNRPVPTSDEISRVMSALGKIGGPRGGKARAEKLSKKRKSEIAKKAAFSRWHKK